MYEVASLSLFIQVTWRIRHLRCVFSSVKLKRLGTQLGRLTVKLIINFVLPFFPENGWNRRKKQVGKWMVIAIYDKVRLVEVNPNCFTRIWCAIKHFICIYLLRVYMLYVCYAVGKLFSSYCITLFVRAIDIFALLINEMCQITTN